MCLFSFFFFKQKTAYEMRISDWSSDVCSSDLIPRSRAYARGRTMIWPRVSERVMVELDHAAGEKPAQLRPFPPMERAEVLPPNQAAVSRISDGCGKLQPGLYHVPNQEHEVRKASCRERALQSR